MRRIVRRPAGRSQVGPVAALVLAALAPALTLGAAQARGGQASGQPLGGQALGGQALAPLADTQGYAPSPQRTVQDHVFCIAGAAGAVYVSDAFAAPPGRAIDLLRDEWTSFMHAKNAAADFADCSHNLPDKAAAYRQRDAAAGAQLRARGVQRVTYTGWIG